MCQIYYGEKGAGREGGEKEKENEREEEGDDNEGL